MSATPAPWILPGVVDPRFCQSCSLVLPWSVLLCCLSIQPFSAPGRISWYQPRPQFCHGTCHVGTFLPMMSPAVVSHLVFVARGIHCTLSLWVPYILMCSLILSIPSWLWHQGIKFWCCSGFQDDLDTWSSEEEATYVLKPCLIIAYTTVTYQLIQLCL